MHESSFGNILDVSFHFFWSSPPLAGHIFKIVVYSCILQVKAITFLLKIQSAAVCQTFEKLDSVRSPLKKNIMAPFSSAIKENI